MIFYDPWTSLVILLIALGLDRWLGQPYIYHPLVGFGRLATALESLLRHEEHSPGRQRVSGGLLVLLLMIPLVGMVAWLDTQVVAGAVADMLLLYLALGLRDLKEHCETVVTSLGDGDLAVARDQVGLMAGRNSVDMNEAEVTRATVESVLENGNDAVLATLFWFLLAGGAGAVLYRLVITLDAMWGHKTGPYLYFGRAVTRLDELLNWLPVRLTVLLYALAGRSRAAMKSARQELRNWERPGAALVIAAGATALGISVGGGSAYGQQLRERPILGSGRPPESADIPRALGLVGRSVKLLLLLQLLIAGGWSLA